MQKLLSDSKFIAEIVKLKSKEEVRNYFTSSGYEITDKEIKDLKTLFGRIYSQVNELSNEEKEELINFGQKSKKEIRNLTLEELQKTSGGISKGGAIGAGIGALIGAEAVCEGLVAGHKKIVPLCKKIWDKCKEPTILSHNGGAVIMYFCTAGMSTIVPLVAGAAAVTALTAGAVVAGSVAGGGIGYLIGNSADK